MRRQRNTKIIATLGPSSSRLPVIRALFEAGADVFRLNFSHGDHKTHRELFGIIRALEAEVGRPIGIVGDLQGPKLRIGTFVQGPVILRQDQTFQFDLSPVPGDATRVHLPHPEIFAAATVDTELLIDDGRLRLKVTKPGTDTMEAVVQTGGRISDNKGVNVPGVALPLKPLTTKDRVDLDFALALGVDWVALSFVQRAADVEEVRNLIAGRAALMTKVEKPTALDELEGIIRLSDGVMVARGDLGVEMAIEAVPASQKRLVRAARNAGKPIVIATQMLDSMIHAPTPTRAEVSDVATAVYDGADAVMLSAESAAGAHPISAVRMMARIAEQTERDPLYRAIMNADLITPEATLADAICASAAQTAETLKAVAIVGYTDSGSTALRAARERPTVPVIGLTPKVETARKLAIAWGVHSVTSRDPSGFDDMLDIALEAAAYDGFGKSQDHLVIIAGVPFGSPGGTNVMRVARIP
ncbi:MAG: pyruvate kinase [Alphaproteobacteria bacterium]|nr:pyruvate kinase [Alphaproteobacteria bacterium]